MEEKVKMFGEFIDASFELGGEIATKNNASALEKKFLEKLMFLGLDMMMLGAAKQATKEANRKNAEYRRMEFGNGF